MRILYVAGLWEGLKELVTGGHEEPGSVPAFLHPLKELVSRGHVVDLVMNASDPDLEIDIGTPWLQDADVRLERWQVQGWRRLTAPFWAYAIYRRLREQLQEGEYDLVYGHGAFGVLGNMAALREGVPCGMRMYGTFLAHELQTRSRLAVAARHPFEALAYWLPKEFMISTDDGQCADEVYQAYAADRDTYDFHFWLNGVRRPHDVDLDAASDPFHGVPRDGPILFVPASILRWKRQHLAVNMLATLHELGLDETRLVLAGHILDKSYLAEIRTQARRLGLTSYVHHVGLLDTPTLYRGYREADAVLTVAWLSNLGNIFIEAMAAGAVLGALDDGMVSLAGIIEPDEEGLLASSLKELVEDLAAVIEDPSRQAQLREGARRCSQREFPTWEERASREIDLLLSVAQGDRDAAPTPTSSPRPYSPQPRS